MKLNKLAQLIDGNILAPLEEPFEFSEFYAGDFLSRVMGRAPTDCAWFTIMNNINVAGAAVMAQIKAIIFCEDIVPQEQVIEKCLQEHIAVIRSPLTVYDCCARVARHEVLL